MQRQTNIVPCSVPECSKPARLRGLCGMHHQRWLRYGDLNRGSPTLEQRFWAKVDKSGECWLWTASCRPDGYGQIRVGPTFKGAHAIGYILQIGPVPAEMQVLHRCDNPPCVRGDHLFLGTPLDNMTDKIAKGRLRVAHGEQQGGAKLTEADIPVIRQRWRAGESQVSIGRAYGVTFQTIWQVVHGKSWAHIP